MFLIQYSDKYIILTMFLDQFQLSILIHDLMLVLKLLCGEYSYFHHADCIQAYCIYLFSFFLLKLEDRYQDHEAL